VTFAGFGEHAVEFYDGLMADNSKPYWDDNLAVYRADVRAPMEALLAELAPEFGPNFGEGKVFRPHRDVRFAADKSPYKTHCGAVIEQGRGGGAYYVELSCAGLRAGGGCFHLASDQLARFRQAVDTDIHGKALEKILASLRKTGWEIKGDALKTKPVRPSQIGNTSDRCIGGHWMPDVGPQPLGKLMAEDEDAGAPARSFRPAR